MSLTETTHTAFLNAIGLFDSRVAVTSEASWSAPSPCDGWTARDVVAHVVTNLRALTTALRGEDFFSSFGQPVQGDIRAAWDEQCAAVSGLLRRLDDVEFVPVGGDSIPTHMVVDGLARDLVIHTWDLARAVGGDEDLPTEQVLTATASMDAVGPEQRRPGLYGQALPPPAAASPLVRLLALSGRAVD
ncbi:MAG: hypothetical protein JWM76_1477 [Pseudonocardiales bacterium]|nr:hypothetical protein [Pseudonocardiales bacterium]